MPKRDLLTSRHSKVKARGRDSPLLRFHFKQRPNQHPFLWICSPRSAISVWILFPFKLKQAEGERVRAGGDAARRTEPNCFRWTLSAVEETRARTKFSKQIKIGLTRLINVGKGTVWLAAFQPDPIPEKARFS